MQKNSASEMCVLGFVLIALESDLYDITFSIMAQLWEELVLLWEDLLTWNCRFPLNKLCFRKQHITFSGVHLQKHWSQSMMQKEEIIATLVSFSTVIANSSVLFPAHLVDALHSTKHVKFIAME